MFSRLKKLFSPLKGEHEPDKKLMIAIGALSLFGIVMLSSASSVVAYSRFHNSYHYFTSQLISLLIAVSSCLIISRIDYHVWRKYSIAFLVGSILLLLTVFIPGLRAEFGTAHSWINVFGHSIQPSEFVKLAFLFYLAAWLEVKKDKLNDYSQGIVPFILVLGIIGALMYAQPDMGTLFIIAASSVAVFWVGGGSLKHILLLGLVALVALFAAVSLNSYQSNRIQCLKDPNMDRQDKCYQINQSLIAVGSGGYFGRGIGQSRQKFNYLPEVWGDAIFSIISEEIGFIFDLALLAVYGFIFYRGYLIALRAPDDYGRNIAIGVVFWIIIQAFLNIGGMINLIPMTGVPLPFISYGGTAIISVMIAVGVLINISKQTKESLRH